MFPEVSPSIYQSPKCLVHYGTMGHVDRRNMPRASKPWNTVLAQDFIYQVDLVAPRPCLEGILEKLSASPAPCYSKVVMSLANVLDGSFFTEYIKRGNIMMLSQGNDVTDNLFTLQEGVLTMYLDKETYERAGLVGKPHGSKGNRGLKPRWVVTYNLREPSMLHGKKGFDRLVYAAKKTLSEALSWLFCNVDPTTPDPDPLDKYSPTKVTGTPQIDVLESTVVVDMLIPPEVLAEGDRLGFEERAADLYEFTSLIRLGSPRIAFGDVTDPFLARYNPPEGPGGACELMKARWTGLFGANWLQGVLVECFTGCPSESWFSASSTCFSRGFPKTGNEVTILRPQKAVGEYLMWHIQG